MTETMFKIMPLDGNAKSRSEDKKSRQVNRFKSRTGAGSFVRENNLSFEELIKKEFQAKTVKQIKTQIGGSQLYLHTDKQVKPEESIEQKSMRAAQAYFGT